MTDSLLGDGSRYGRSAFCAYRGVYGSRAGPRADRIARSWESIDKKGSA